VTFKRILVATDNRFWRRSIGSQQRIWSLYRHLRSQGHQTRALFLGELTAADRAILESTGLIYEIETVAAPQHSLGGRLVRAAKGVLPSGLKDAMKSAIHGTARLRTPSSAFVPRAGAPTLRELESPRYVAALSDACQRMRPEVLIVEYVRLSYLVRRSSPAILRGVLKLLDTHDVMHIRHQRFLNNRATSDLAISREEEARAIAPFDHVLAIQEEDARELRAMCPTLSVVIVGHPWTVKPAALASPKPTGSCVVLGYIGSAMAPNVAAARFLATTAIAELKPRCVPQIKLVIAGGVCGQLADTQLPADVELLGFVEHLEDFYSQIDVLLNPVEFGTGLKIKNVEALCAGKPLVTTPVGAEGLGQTGTAFLVAGSKEDFIEQVARLVNDSAARERLSRAAIDLANVALTEDAAYAELRRLIA
jgi:hypothetical protein